jgi:hypothetical protein
MSNQIDITGGARVRNLNGVILGTTGVLTSVPYGGANGVATLDSSGKVPVSQLPSSVVTYLGTWNAATNTPTLVNGTGDAGDLYLCNVAGTVNFGAGPITFAIGDWVLYGSGNWQKSNGQNGTVTSVGVASGAGVSALSITGSPITTAGTITIDFAGTNSQYVTGSGGLTTFPSLTGFVPYTGATNDLNLGTHNLFANNLFDGFTNVAASGTQIVLTIASTPSYTITGSGGQTIKLPDATTLPNGAIFSFNNNQSSGAITINNNSNTLVVSVPSGGFAEVVLLDNSIAAGSWDRHFKAPSNVSWSTNTLDYAGSITSATWNGNVVAINRGGTGSSTQNFVDLTTTQTIGGAKTFTSLSNFDNVIRLKQNLGVITTNTGYTTLFSTEGSGAYGFGFYNGSGVVNFLNFSSTTGYTYTFPNASGTIALVGGSGVGTVTSVAALTLGTTGTDLSSTVATSTTTPVITLNVPTANATNRGALSSTDWSTFNGKESALTFSSPLVRTTNTISIPVATTSVNGYLSSTDWTTFNNKLSTSTAASTYVPYTGANANVDLGTYSLTSTGITVKKSSGISTITFPQGFNDPAFIQHEETTANTGIMRFSVGDDDLTNDYFVFGNTSNATSYVERFKITASGIVNLGTWQGTAIGDAYISSAATWNAKQNAITLTTTGTSGAATFVSNTLNIPNYGSALSGYVPYTGATTDVNLGSRALSAGNILGTTLSASQTSNSQPSLSVTNAGTFRIADFNNSGALVAYITNAGSIYGYSFVKSGGSSSQFLKADGTIDSTSYYSSGGGIITGNIYMQSSSNPSQLLAKGTNTEFWVDSQYGGGSARAFINRNSTGNQSTLMFTTGVAITNGTAWAGSVDWSMGMTNDATNNFYIGYGDIYSAGNRKLTIASTGAATFSSTLQSGSLTVSDVTANTYFYNTFSNAANRNWALAFGIGNLGDFNIMVSNAQSGNPISAGTSKFNIQTNGNLGLGTNSPTAAAGLAFVLNSGASQGRICIKTSSTGDASGAGLQIGMAGTSAFIEQRENADLTLATNASERMRITNQGQTQFIHSQTDLDILYARNGSSSPYGMNITFTAASPNNSTNNFTYFADSSGLRCRIMSNGGIANYATNNIVLSDERLKKDITPLESVWDKVKNIEIVKYKFNDQTHDDFNIGVIAQQVEKIAPELIEIEGWGTIADDGTNYKGVYEADINYYSIKALQEAMIRIEEQQLQIKELKKLILNK